MAGTNQANRSKLPFGCRAAALLKISSNLISSRNITNSWGPSPAMHSANGLNWVVMRLVMDNCSAYMQLIAGLGLNSWVQHMLEGYFKIVKVSEGHLNIFFVLLASPKTWNVPSCKWAAAEELSEPNLPWEGQLKCFWWTLWVDLVVIQHISAPVEKLHVSLTKYDLRRSFHEERFEVGFWSSKAMKLIEYWMWGHTLCSC